MTRACGDCTACCRIVPVRELGKGHNTRCAHQRFGKGCTIYAQRPLPCRLWSCLWLLEGDAADLRRPDRAGYVIDIVPDSIVMDPHDGTPPREMQVVQIWADPKRPGAHHDDALLAWLERRWTDSQILGLVRFDTRRAVVLMPPALTKGGWVEIGSNLHGHEHSAKEIVETLGGGA